jgi:DNA-binding LytR/AlgR family response regulator
MIRIAICDDEEAICSMLEEDIRIACARINIKFEIDVFSSGSNLKQQLIKGNMYNIFFLDIELNDESGITISDCIRNEINDESAQIVYVSGKTEYDRQLFAFRPFSFIEKPFDVDVICTTLEKYIRIYGTKNNLFHYQYGNVICLSSKDEFYGTISSLIEQLSSREFISPHKSYLVNYRFIKVFQSDAIIMVNGDKIPIAKGKRDEISKLQLHFENGGY